MKRLLFIYIFCLLVCQLPAQEEFHKDIPYYEGIDYSYNSIRIPGGDSCRMDAFFRKIDSLFVFGTGKINILHIGGSHVQADFFSNQVRRNLDEINRDFKPSRGYIFPFSVAKTNNPTNYSVKYKGKWDSARDRQKNRNVPLGVGGVAVYTNDPKAEISVSLNVDESDYRWDFDALELIGYSEDESEGVKPVLKYKDSINIEGIYNKESKSYLFSLPELADSFTIHFLQEDEVPHTFILNGFIPLKDEEGVVYHAIGANGATVSSYLDRENFEDELKLITPDLVIFGIGINDASGKNFNASLFIENYNRLIDKIERISPHCAFIFITNNDSFRRISRRKYAVNRNGLIVQKAFYSLAQQRHGGVWDLFALMGGLGSMQQWEKRGLAKVDKVHFTKEGYMLIGDLFYNALMDYYLHKDMD
jgi:lysophospholipase L1-like esterase